MPSRLFVASIGNPGNLYGTLHSSGHLVADALQRTLGLPAFSKDADGGQVSEGAPYTLYKSAKYMNESGAAVAPAYRRWVRALPRDEQAGARLVVLHDELELAVGRVGWKSPNTSLRGHNGLKSIVKVLGSRDFGRVAVGIGRPESRESQAVADYVLSRMKSAQKEKIVDRVDSVIEMLDTYSKGG